VKCAGGSRCRSNPHLVQLQPTSATGAANAAAAWAAAPFLPFLPALALGVAAQRWMQSSDTSGVTPPRLGASPAKPLRFALAACLAPWQCCANAASPLLSTSHAKHVYTWGGWVAAVLKHRKEITIEFESA
jgi:hypothetical protein